VKVLAKIHVTLKPGVNDPQGQAILGGLHTLGFGALGIVLALVVWAAAVTIEGEAVTTYLLPAPLLLVVGGTLAALLIGYGGSGVGALPGLIGQAFRGAARVTGGGAEEAAARYRLGERSRTGQTLPVPTCDHPYWMAPESRHLRA
jgi:hypothetical protein